VLKLNHLKVILELTKMAKKIQLSYDDWKKETKRGVFTPRSKRLKAIDTTYDKYWNTASTNTNLQKLKDALTEWLRWKGMDSAPNTQDGKWRSSTRNKTGTIENLYDQLFPPPRPPEPGEIRFAASFRNATQLNRVDSTRAFKDAIELITKAWPSIALAPGDGSDARATYEEWFGAFNGIRHAKVRKNINKIYLALTERPVMMYYRGSRLPANSPNDEAGRNTPISPENFFGAAYPVQPAALDQRFTHLFLGQAFFSAATLFQNDSMGGVMIHELSHAICQTDDVNYQGKTTYGEDLCQTLAIDRPDLAINNADCYEYYCESFQPQRYQSVRPVLNLPPKASINIPL